MNLLFYLSSLATLLRDWTANTFEPTVMEGSICEWNSHILPENGDGPLQVLVVGDCSHAVTHGRLYRRFGNEFRLRQVPEDSITYSSGIKDGLSYVNLTIPRSETVDYLSIYCTDKGKQFTFSLAKRSLVKQLEGLRNELRVLTRQKEFKSLRQARQAQRIRQHIVTLGALQRNQPMNRDICTTSDTVTLRWIVESSLEDAQEFSCTNNEGQPQGNYTVRRVDSSEKLVELTFTVRRSGRMLDVYNCNLGGEAESSTLIQWLDL